MIPCSEWMKSRASVSLRKHGIKFLHFLPYSSILSMYSSGVSASKRHSHLKSVHVCAITEGRQYSSNRLNRCSSHWRVCVGRLALSKVQLVAILNRVMRKCSIFRQAFKLSVASVPAECKDQLLSPSNPAGNKNVTMRESVSISSMKSSDAGISISSPESVSTVKRGFNSLSRYDEIMPVD